MFILPTAEYRRAWIFCLLQSFQNEPPPSPVPSLASNHSATLASSTLKHCQLPSHLAGYTDSSYYIPNSSSVRLSTSSVMADLIVMYRDGTFHNDSSSALENGAYTSSYSYRAILPTFHSPAIFFRPTRGLTGLSESQALLFHQ